MNKWVINLSNEIDLLRKGLNFVGTPRRVPKKEILASVEQGVKDLTDEAKNDIRAGVFSILKHAKPLSAQNLTWGGKKAIKDLRSEDTIIITKADKGNAVVIMDKAKYTDQVNEMLGDQTVYTRITDKRRNPIKWTETDLENILKGLRRLGNITDREYWQLRVFDSSPATFYGLPKVHKVCLVCNQDHYTLSERSVDIIPLHPINSNIGSPTYPLSKYLAKLLKIFCIKKRIFNRQWERIR
jgi:hypothetical protein